MWRDQSPCRVSDTGGSSSWSTASRTKESLSASRASPSHIVKSQLFNTHPEEIIYSHNINSLRHQVALTTDILTRWRCIIFFYSVHFLLLGVCYDFVMNEKECKPILFQATKCTRRENVWHYKKTRNLNQTVKKTYSTRFLLSDKVESKLLRNRLICEWIIWHWRFCSEMYAQSAIEFAKTFKQ